MGDLVHTMPVIADIHRAYPNATIDWVVEEAFVDLVKHVRGVRHVIPVALRRWRHTFLKRNVWQEINACWHALRAERYDWIIDAQGLLKSAILSRCARGRVAGLANRTEGASYEWPVRFFYQRRIYIAPRTHVVPRARLLVAQTLAYPLPDQLEFGLEAANSNITPFIDQPYVVFVHAASRADKAWPIASWVRLGQRFISAGYRIVLPWGSKTEGQISQQLAQILGEPAWVPRRLELGPITSLLAQASAVVGLDTGLTHIAVALDRPTVQLHCRDTAWRAGGLDPSKVINLGDKKHIPEYHEVEAALTKLSIL